MKGNTVDWEKLKAKIKWGVRFLDDVIEVNKYPLPEIQEMTLQNLNMQEDAIPGCVLSE